MPSPGRWLAGNEGMEKKMETTIRGYIGTTSAFTSRFYGSLGLQGSGDKGFGGVGSTVYGFRVLGSRGFGVLCLGV